MLKFVHVSDEKWDRECNDMGGTWKHRSLWYQYKLLSPNTYDCRKLIYDGERVVGALPLMLEDNLTEGTSQYTMGGGPLPSLLYCGSHEYRDMENILDHVKELSKTNDVARIHIDGDVPSYDAYTAYHRVISGGTVNVSHGNAKIIAAMSDKYKVENENNFVYFSNKYEEIAGKSTHTDKQWSVLRLMYGLGIMQVYRITRLGDYPPCGYVAIFVDNNSAYYAMGAVEEQAKKDGAGVVLLSSVISSMLHIGRIFDIGEQPYPSSVCGPTGKELTIAQFKRGFGGVTVRDRSSEMFFNVVYKRKVYAERLEQEIQQHVEVRG